jgi:Membrane protein involved in the export of O-antigen and teichoic acid
MIQEKYIEKIQSFFGPGAVGKRVSSALTFSFAGAAASKVLILLLNILLSRALGQETYGQYSLVNNTVQTFVTFASIGLGASLVRYTSLYRNADKKRCGQMIGTFVTLCAAMSVIVSAVVFAASDAISLWVGYSDSLPGLLRLSAVLIFFIALSSILQSVLIGFEDYRSVAKNEIIFGVLSVIIVYGTARLLGITGAILGMLVAKICNTVFLGRSAVSASKKYGIKWKLCFDKNISAAFRGFVFPSFLSSVLVLPVTWYINILLVQTSGYAELAVYSIAMQWIAMITYILSLFTRVKPIYTELYSNGNIAGFKKLLKKMILVSSSVGVPIALCGAVCSEFIMSLYGKSYAAYWCVFAVMMAASIAVTLQYQFGAVFESIGRMWLGFILNIIWAVNSLALFYFLKRYGALGCSVAYLGSYILHCAYCWGIFFRITRNGTQNINSMR